MSSVKYSGPGPDFGFWIFNWGISWYHLNGGWYRRLIVRYQFNVHGTVHRWMCILYNQRDATYTMFSTRFGRFFRPSSGAYKTVCAALGIVMLSCCLPLVWLGWLYKIHKYQFVNLFPIKMYQNYCREEIDADHWYTLHQYHWS